MALRVEVTDGWYCLPAVLDGPLADLVRQGKIQVNGKGTGSVYNLMYITT